MNLKQFSELAGFELCIEHDKEEARAWGGKYGYRTKDYPNCWNLGFKTERAARTGWLKDTFGDVAGGAVLKLLGREDT